MLKFVTLTGADDSIEPMDLIELSQEFPFVEWGILVSMKQQGKERFPSLDWMDQLAMDCYSEIHETPVNLSLHVCGKYTRDILAHGDDTLFKEMGMELLMLFNRVQLNTHCEAHDWNLEKLSAMMSNYKDKEFIFQLDGNSTNESKAKLLRFDHKVMNMSFLHDCSHGAGLLPFSWPIPPVSTVATGYAGGLGGDVLEGQYKHIKRAVDLRADFIADHWIDMETKVRSGDSLNPDEKFDLDKCRKVLEIAKPWFDGQHAQV